MTTLTRVSNEAISFPLSATNPDGTPVTITGAKVALLPKRRGPNAATVWTTASFAAGTVSIRLAGPDADPTGATLVVGEAGGDLWALPLGITDYNPVRIERVYLLDGTGAGNVPTGTAYVTSLAGLTGVLTAQAAVDALAGPLDAAYATDTALTTGLAGKVDTSTYTAGLASKAPADPVLSAFSYDAATGNLLSYQEDGITITLTYNADGTVATSKRGTNATRTFSYSGGNLTGVA